MASFRQRPSAGCRLCPPTLMSFIRSSRIPESRIASDKGVQKSRHFRVGGVFRDSLSSTLISQIRKIKERDLARITQKMKGGAKSHTQVLHNHYISTKPRTITLTKSGESSSPMFSGLDLEHQLMADVSRLSHSVLSNQILGSGRGDC